MKLAVCLLFLPLSRGLATYLNIVWVVGAEARNDIVVVTARLSLTETLGAFLLLESERKHRVQDFPDSRPVCQPDLCVAGLVCPREGRLQAQAGHLGINPEEQEGHKMYHG